MDVQSAKRETVLRGDVIESLPGTHAYGTLLNAMPGVTVDGNGLANTPTMTFFTARGGSTNEGRMTINGMVVAASFNGGGVSSLAYDANNVDEVSVVVSGGLGETDVGGPVMNLVPRTGGNTFKGQVFLNTAGSWSTRRQPRRSTCATCRRRSRWARASSAPTMSIRRTAGRSSATDCGSGAAIASSRRRRASKASSPTSTRSTRRTGTT